MCFQIGEYLYKSVLTGDLMKKKILFSLALCAHKVLALGGEGQNVGGSSSAHPLPGQQNPVRQEPSSLRSIAQIVSGLMNPRGTTVRVPQTVVESKKQENAHVSGVQNTTEPVVQTEVKAPAITESKSSNDSKEENSFLDSAVLNTVQKTSSLPVQEQSVEKAVVHVSVTAEEKISETPAVVVEKKDLELGEEEVTKTEVIPEVIAEEVTKKEVTPGDESDKSRQSIITEMEALLQKYKSAPSKQESDLLDLFLGLKKDLAAKEEAQEMQKYPLHVQFLEAEKSEDSEKLASLSWKLARYHSNYDQPLSSAADMKRFYLSVTGEEASADAESMNQNLQVNLLAKSYELNVSNITKVWSNTKDSKALSKVLKNTSKPAFELSILASEPDQKGQWARLGLDCIKQAGLMQSLENKVFKKDDFIHRRFFSILVDEASTDAQRDHAAFVLDELSKSGSLYASMMLYSYHKFDSFELSPDLALSVPHPQKDFSKSFDYLKRGLKASVTYPEEEFVNVFDLFSKISLLSFSEYPEAQAREYFRKLFDFAHTVQKASRLPELMQAVWSDKAEIVERFSNFYLEQRFDSLKAKNLSSIFATLKKALTHPDFVEEVQAISELDRQWLSVCPEVVRTKEVVSTKAPVSSQDLIVNNPLEDLS
jgi:hypothetical protein